MHDGIGADGYPVYRYFLLTARHVAEHVPAQEKEWAFHPGGYDVAVSEMDPHTIPWSTVNPKELDAFDFDMAMRPERELDGMAGIVLATNKRYRAGEERSAHASRISPVFDVKFLAALGITPESKRRQDRFRMIVLPPGYGAEGPDGQTPTNGDSGAPFLGEKRGSLNVEIDGILAGSVEKVIDGVKYSLAQILDRELIRETIQHAIGPSSGPSRFAEPKLKR